MLTVKVQGMEQRSVKKALQFYPTCQITSSGHGFTGAGRGPKTASLETKDLIPPPVGFLLTAAPRPPRLRADGSVPPGGEHAVGLCHSLGALYFRKPPIL